MNLFSLSWSYIKNKKLNTALNTLLLALGVGIIIFLLLIQAQIEEKFSKNVRGIKMVVGAKGSPLQLILCNVYHIDNPTGNIPLKDANFIAQNRRFVKKSIPLALGDSYESYRIVGTNHDYPKHYQCQLKEGKLWQKDLEVTIGSEVAQKLKLKIGSTFFGAHGLDAEGHSHESHPYKVVGILAPNNTIIDRIILTNIASVWLVHEEPKTENVSSDTIQIIEREREITALLITEYRNPIAAINLPRMVNAQGNLQAASPALEITRLFNLIGIGGQVLQVFALIIIAIASLSIFIALYNTLKERQYDLAIMRTLGATKSKLFSQIILEGLILAFMGALLGFLLGHLTVELIGKLENVSDKIQLTGWLFLWQETWIILMIFVVGIISSLIPAIQTYRIDISKTLTQ